ncbi:MAG: hypothetical protein KAJ58_00485 [Candidatus Pacebacteria bacterium]|nr:hypothetical protein [Candidatus Paceibacterota bacterium]
MNDTKERLEKALREEALSKNICPECEGWVRKEQILLTKEIVHVRNYVANYPYKRVQVRRYQIKRSCCSCDWSDYSNFTESLNL